MTSWLIGNRDLIQFSFNMGYIIAGLTFWRGLYLIWRSTQRR